MDTGAETTGDGITGDGVTDGITGPDGMVITTLITSLLLIVTTTGVFTTDQVESITIGDIHLATISITDIEIEPDQIQSLVVATLKVVSFLDQEIN